MQRKDINRLVAVGDIHGHLDKLIELISQVQPTSDDLLVFLGDYVNRGPESRGVIEFLIRLAEEFPQTVFLRGNHDQMLLDVLASNGLSHASDQSSLRVEDGGTDIALFKLNGGDSTLDSYGWEVPLQHVAFLESTRLWWRYMEFLFVHAGCPVDGPETADPDALLWSRDCDPGTNGEIHIVGHTPCETQYPELKPGRYMLDTGCAYEGPLSACDVLTKDVWQAK